MTLVLQRFVSAEIKALIERTWISDCSCERVLGPVSQKNLKSDRNRKLISGAKMYFTKNHNLMITSVLERE